MNKPEYQHAHDNYQHQEAKFLITAKRRLVVLVLVRVAQSAGIGELDSSIAKDLIDSEDPKHTQFCREITFVAIYALFRDDISIL